MGSNFLQGSVAVRVFLCFACGYALSFALRTVNAVIAPNSSSTFSMTSKVRELPIEYVLLPYETVIDSQTYQLPFTCT